MGFDPSWTTRRLVARREELARQLPLHADFTPGSVHETWSRCGKPTCHCAKDGDRGHGPRLLWVRYGGGKTRSKTVPAPLAGRVREQVDRFRAFTGKVNEINEINAVLAERELSGRTTSAPTDPGRSGQRGGSTSGPRTRPG